MSDYGLGQPLKWRNAQFATIITRKLKAEVHAELGDAMPDTIYIRPMGVDTNVLKRNTLYDLPSANEPLRIFSCARLNIVKGHQDAMAAVQNLKAKGLNVQLEIAGEDDAGGGGYRLILEALIKESGLESKVKLLGRLTRMPSKQNC